MNITYHARNATTEIKRALAHIIESVPAEIKAEHWVLAKHSPQAWQELANKYVGDAKLDAIASLTACVSNLQSVVAALEAADRPPDLRLGKLRRETHGGAGSLRGKQ